MMKALHLLTVGDYLGCVIGDEGDCDGNMKIDLFQQFCGIIKQGNTEIWPKILQSNIHNYAFI